MDDEMTVREYTEKELKLWEPGGCYYPLMANQYYQKRAQTLRDELAWYNSDEPRKVWRMEYFQGDENIILTDYADVEAELAEYEEWEDAPNIEELTMTGREVGNLRLGCL